MRSIASLASWATIAIVGAGGAYAAPPSFCRSYLLGQFALATRNLTTNDLVRLRDIGEIAGDPGDPSPISVSPDGKWAAFQLRRADPDANRYCLGMMVVSLTGKHQAQLVDVGGEVIRWTGNNRNLVHTPSGIPKAIIPVWSPDGRSIIYLRRDRGRTRIWRSTLLGRARPLTSIQDNVVDMRSSSPGRVTFTTDAAFQAAQALIANEGLSGWRYDQRFWNLSNSAPWPESPKSDPEFELDLASGHAHPTVGGNDTVSPSAQHGTRPPSGPGTATVSLVPIDANRFDSDLQIRMSAAGEDKLCLWSTCKGRLFLPIHAERDQGIVFLRSEGPDGADGLAIYRWDPRTSAEPTRLIATQDLLFGCDLRDDAHLLCLREGALRPRYVDLIDLQTGHDTVVYDPNPGFSAFLQATVQRLSWRTAAGKQGFADLVLPPGHKAGQRHPMVVVQYRSHGFLRGGTGDEYPILPMAARGYAVLSFDRTDFYGERETGADIDTVVRANIKGWADRKDVLESLEAGIREAEELGVIDEKRIGITGLSDGSSTVQYALINSRIFSAAAVSTCCEDAVSAMTAVGRPYSDNMIRWGYPQKPEDWPTFWKPYSLAANAANVKVPILMQLPEAEYRLALESIYALQSHGTPIDVRVFPDEFHNKWQPTHRLAIYNRSIAWFDFWLRGEEPADLSDREHWDALRQGRNWATDLLSASNKP